MTQLSSHQIQSTREFMLPATQLGTHTKFATKQKATTSASYHACTKCYSGQLALSSIAVAMGRGVLTLQVMMLM